MKCKFSYLLFCACLFAGFAQAQAPPSNLRNKVMEVQDVMLLDSLSIVPGTFSIEGINPSQYVLDEINSTLTWVNKPVQSQVKINFRVFHIKMNERYNRFDYDSIRFNFLAGNVTKVKTAEGRSPAFFDFGKLSSSGSFGRAISFGNNQDAVVNSTMNLQLHGFIGDSLELTAAITDNNLPIQPEGNTQDLHDFDRIYLQIKKKSWEASFGDIDIRESSSYFLNFYKRLQGASFLTKNKISKNINNTFFASGAIAKGKFNRYVLTPVEGNQGPYRLQGANNELYFVVLGGTERVFIDGELLQRGEDQDYVINYNTAEVTFTPKRMITKDRRIQVEFEYADRNFLNSQIFAVNEMKFSEKLLLNVAFYNNIDARNSSIDQVLDVNQKQFLSDVGDSVHTAYYQNAVRDTFALGKILYTKIEVIYNGTVRDSIFVISTDPTVSLYNLSFTFLGPGKGNYKQILGNINGQAFEWVQPGPNGELMGDWEPVTLLITPKQQQVLSVGVKYAINQKNKVSAEIGVSKYDVNLFSSKDKGNDNGFAAKLRFDNTDRKLNIFGVSSVLNFSGGYEYVSERFKPLERLRNIEFYRDWSLPLEALNADENIINASLHLTRSKQIFKYEVTNYNRNDGYNGLRNNVTWQNEVKGWKWNAKLAITTFNGTDTDGDFVRPYFDFSKTLDQFKKIQVGVKYTGEMNTVRPDAHDTLTLNSFAFHIYEAYVKTDPAKANKWGLSYARREDYLPYQNKLIKTDLSNNYTLTAELLKNENNQLKSSVTFRDLNVMTTARPSLLKAEESLLGRLEYYISKWDDFVTANFLYEVGTGQEQKRDFSYLEVPAGQGEYAWFDYNGNGIPELNEFEIAVFQDQKRYIRVFTPGSEYVKANYLQFNYSINLEPARLLKKQSTLINILKRTTSSSALQINKKKMASDGFLFNPFEKSLLDTNLVSFNLFMSNTIFFNRTNPKWGLEITESRAGTKALLAYGFEARDNNIWSFKARYAFNKKLQTGTLLRLSNNELATTGSNFNNRNYDISQVMIEPTLTYMYKSSFRAILSYSFLQKENNRDSMEQSKHHSLSADLRYNALTNSTISAKLTYNHIDFIAYTGAENSTVGFMMLDGLLPGKNFLWTIDLTKRLAGNLELSLQYEGRKPGETRVIHTGRAAIRALF